MADEDLADALNKLAGQTGEGGGGNARPGPASSERPASANPPVPSRPARPEAPPQIHHASHADDEELVAAEMDDEQDEADQPVVPAAAINPLADLRQDTAPAAASLHYARPRKKDGGLKATFAPVLITVGVLLMIPAVWATLLLAGVEVPLTDRPNAAGMAKIMLTAWPIGIILMISGIVCLTQVLKGR